jgi:long-subunit acyl-CoA synthetase (AMP-forming)
VESVNDKAISRVAQVKKWRIMDRDFSIDGGELTPTFKLKRRVISKLHADTIESLYSEAKL